MEVVSRAVEWMSCKADQAEKHLVEDWLLGWTPSRIPNMRGKTALVTGGNSGLGFETCRKLAENGAKVYLVSRDAKNGHAAAARIRDETKRADVEVLECDMSVLSNVADLVSEVRKLIASSGGRLDLLVNMAGVFHPGPYAKTKDGIEQTLAIDYYAPALLTLGLLDTLRATPGARVLMMSSAAEQFGRLDWTNLKGDKFRDSGLVPYGTAKLYMLMFARELASRVPEIDVLGVHPGVVMTPLQYKASLRYWTAWLITSGARLFGQTQYRGAYSTLYAASEPSLTGKGFAFIGPNNLNLYPTVERQPFARPVHNPIACWRLFEETVATLHKAVGPAALPHVPRHPDDVYGDSPSATSGRSSGRNAPVAKMVTPPAGTTAPIKAASGP